MKTYTSKASALFILRVVSTATDRYQGLKAGDRRLEKLGGVPGDPLPRKGDEIPPTVGMVRECGRFAARRTGKLTPCQEHWGGPVPPNQRRDSGESR
jgi:hypothetical protein